MELPDPTGAAHRVRKVLRFVSGDVRSDVATRPGEHAARAPARFAAGLHHERRAVSFPLAVVLGLAALAAYELQRAAAITSHLANEDTSIIWVAARDFMSGLFRQPNYYGQSYGSTIEAVPIGIAHALGAAWGPATAYVLGGVEFAGWALLAWSAWRRGRRVLAALAVATPVLLAAYHTIYVTIELQAPGPRFLVIAAAALLIALPTRLPALALAVLLFGVGLQFDAASAVLAVPVVAWFSLSYLRSRHQAYAIAAGAVVPVVQFALTKMFYTRHPDYAFHISPTFRPDGKTFSNSVGHLRDFFALYAPELLRSWLVPAVALLVLVGVLLATRRTLYALPALLTLAIVPYAMSTSRARPEWSLGPLLPRGRIFLALPATLWFLCFLVAESGILARVTTRIGTQQALVAVGIVCVASTLVRVTDFGSREGFWSSRSLALGSQGAYGFARNAVVDRECDDAVAVARRNHIGLILFQQQHPAYSCAARAPSGTDSLTNIERRTWALYEEVDHARSGVLIVDPLPRLCDIASQRAACSRVGRYVVLTFPRQPALPLLASVGFAFRGFGPHCDPTGFFGSCRDPRSAENLERRPFGSPPPDQRQARADITSAYGGMFERAGGGLPNVELGDRVGDVTSGLPRTGLGTDVPTVVDVTFLDQNQARVRFRLGQEVTTGEAVIEGGRWRVALPTFCEAAAQSAGGPQAKLVAQNNCYREAVA